MLPWKKGLRVFCFIVAWMSALFLLLFCYSTARTNYIPENGLGLNVTELASYEEVTFKLLVDTATAPNETQQLALQQLELPNVPFGYWFEMRKASMRLNGSCARAPPIDKLQFHNNYWQSFQRENITFRLFGAYYDVRAHVPEGRVVRVLAMINQIDESFPPSHCQLWFSQRAQPVIVPVSMYKAIWYKAWGSKAPLFPHLLSCAVPKSLWSRQPRAVSLVAHECDTASNSLRVVYEQPPQNATRSGFAVCTKGLDFPYTDLSARLVEWLELLRQLGARKVITYNLDAHPNMTKVLRYYEQQDYVEVHPLTLASNVPATTHYMHKVLHAQLTHKRLNEIIPYNDCFYRNLYKYEYIALMDVDEVIMPLQNRTQWSDLIELAETKRQQAKKCADGYASLCVRNIHFPINAENFTASPRTPSFMFMMQHVRRVAKHSQPGAAVKCLHNTSEVLTLHNHFSLARLKACHSMQFEPETAQLQHYRLLKKPQEWNESVVDTSIYRYKEALETSVEMVLRKLGFLQGT